MMSDNLCPVTGRVWHLHKNAPPAPCPCGYSFTWTPPRGVSEVLSADTLDGGSGRMNISQADADLIAAAPDLAATVERLSEENERLRKQVAELKAPPRGIGGQVITASDSYPTYGSLMAAYCRMEEEWMDALAALGRVQAERDLLAASLSDDGGEG